MHCLVLPSRKVHTFAKANFGAGANPGAFTREGEGHGREVLGFGLPTESHRTLTW